MCQKSSDFLDGWNLYKTQNEPGKFQDLDKNKICKDLQTMG